ncbi:hypothetical protein GCM10017687_27640 [Streptomyces echinatus]
MFPAAARRWRRTRCGRIGPVGQWIAGEPGFRHIGFAGRGEGTGESLALDVDVGQPAVEPGGQGPGAVAGQAGPPGRWVMRTTNASKTTRRGQAQAQRLDQRLVAAMKPLETAVMIRAAAVTTFPLYGSPR